MSTDGIRTQDALDRAEITELMLRYAAGVDRWDWPAVGTCFTTNVRSVFNGNDLGTGVDKIIEYIVELSKRHAIVSFVHLLGNVSIALDGDLATSETYGVSQVVMKRDGAPYLRARGLCYHDELERHEGSWLISSRVLEGVWESQTDLTSVPVEATQRMPSGGGL